MTIAIFVILIAFTLSRTTAGADIVQTATFCEYQNASFVCPSGFIMGVLTATYGRTDYQICRIPPAGKTTNPSGCQAQTVSTRVQQQCNNKPSCSFPVNNAFFGLSNLCPQVYKHVTVIYQCYVPSIPNSKIVFGCERDPIKLECTNGNHLNIHVAAYEKTSFPRCHPQSRNVPDCYFTGTLQAVKAVCQAKSSCNFVAKNLMTPDPCPLAVKYFAVAYTCDPPVTTTTTTVKPSTNSTSTTSTTSTTTSTTSTTTSTTTSPLFEDVTTSTTTSTTTSPLFEDFTATPCGPIALIGLMDCTTLCLRQYGFVFAKAQLYDRMGFVTCLVRCYQGVGGKSDFELQELSKIINSNGLKVLSPEIERILKLKNLTPEDIMKEFRSLNIKKKLAQLDRTKLEEAVRNIKVIEKQPVVKRSVQEEIVATERRLRLTVCYNKCQIKYANFTTEHLNPDTTCTVADYIWVALCYHECAFHDNEYRPNLQPGMFDAVNKDEMMTIRVDYTIAYVDCILSYIQDKGGYNLNRGHHCKSPDYMQSAHCHYTALLEGKAMMGKANRAKRELPDEQVYDRLLSTNCMVECLKRDVVTKAGSFTNGCFIVDLLLQNECLNDCFTATGILERQATWSTAWQL